MSDFRPPVSYIFPSHVIPPGSNALFYINVPAERGKFKPTWFEVPDHLAPHFIVTDIKIGNSSQLISVGAFSVEVFASSAPKDEFECEVAPVGKRVAVSVTNISNLAMEFTCKVWGHHGPVDETFTKPRGLLFGLGYVKDIPAGNELVLKVQPQTDFNPYRLHLPKSVLARFTIKAVESLQAHTVLSTSDAAPLEPATDLPITSSIDSGSLSKENLSAAGIIGFAPKQILTQNDIIKLVVTNTSSEQADFTGLLLGVLPASVSAALAKELRHAEESVLV
jgi:hypothetical protein